MSDITTIAAGILIAAGLAFDVFGCVGLVRLPDVYTRLQAATKCVTLGTCLILLGALVGSIGTDSAGPMVTKAALCIAFVLITSPTAAHALARIVCLRQSRTALRQSARPQLHRPHDQQCFVAAFA